MGQCLFGEARGLPERRLVQAHSNLMRKAPSGFEPEVLSRLEHLATSELMKLPDAWWALLERCLTAGARLRSGTFMKGVPQPGQRPFWRIYFHALDIPMA